MQKSDRVKSELSLRLAVEASGVIWSEKKSRASAGDWWAECPFHGEKSPSFHVVEPSGAGGYFKCFGCGASGTIIDFTMRIWNLDFSSAVRKLVSDAGLPDEISLDRQLALESKRSSDIAKAREMAARRAASGLDAARNIWRGAVVDFGPVARYLSARGVKIGSIGGVPASIRFARHLPHRAGEKRPTYFGPAMVAVVGRSHLVGIHRTWITKDGRARHADGSKVNKQWLGKTGAMMGQPVMLSPPSSGVVVGEGLETTLAAWSGLVAAGMHGWSAEAAISRGAITGPVRDPAQLWTPDKDVREVLILGEGSKKNPRQARGLYEGARARLGALGLSVALRVPRGRWDLDLDFADIALADLVAS